MSSGNVIERVYDAILDRDGTAIYGDERDRLHWYEAIAVAASIQWTLFPWALAILAIIDADRFGPALWALFAVYFVPVAASNVYVSRRKVSPVRFDNPKAIVSALQVIVPTIVFTLAMAWPSGGVDSAFVGGLIGGTVGLAGAIIWGIVRMRRTP
jgi:hypothetical protein